MTKVSRLNLYSTSPIKKKRKSYKRLSINPTFMPALRIFKNDIRRRYIDMITNVINSYDTKLHEKFFLDFALPGATHTYHRFPPEFLALLQHPPHLVGLEQVLHTYEMHYLLILYSDIVILNYVNVWVLQEVELSLQSGLRVKCSLLCQWTNQVRTRQMIQPPPFPPNVV